MLVALAAYTYNERTSGICSNPIKFVPDYNAEEKAAAMEEIASLNKTVAAIKAAIDSL